MTFAARKVLADSRLALAMLEEEKDLARWRVHWAAAVALIRAVGHVLDKVDGEDPSVKRLASAAFRSWKREGPEHEIFREFIEKERNSILKEYRFSHHPLGTVDVAVAFTLKNQKTGEMTQINEVVPIGDNIYRPLVDGFREGDDARDVLVDAIAWWEVQLEHIDVEYKKSIQPNS